MKKEEIKEIRKYCLDIKQKAGWITTTVEQAEEQHPYRKMVFDGDIELLNQFLGDRFDIKVGMATVIVNYDGSLIFIGKGDEIIRLPNGKIYKHILTLH